MINDKNINLNKDEADESLVSEADIDKFRDVDGVSLKELSFGLWYLENKKKLLLTTYIVLGIIGFVTWFIFFKTFAYYIFIGMKEDQKMINEMVTNPGISREKVLQISAQPIQIKSAEVILNSNGTYDIVARIYNGNKNYYSNFSSSFVLGNEVFGPIKSFILPEEEKMIFLLNQELSRRPSSVDLDIVNSWGKIDRHKIRDWDNYKNDFIDFTVSDKVFYSSRESNLTEKVNLSVVEFNIRNNSAYSYYNVPLDILLYSRGQLVSVNKYSVDRFLSGETRKVNVTWSGVVPRADEIEVIPYVNIMDSNFTFIP